MASTERRHSKAEFPFPGGLGIILPALRPAREVLHWTGIGRRG